MRGRGVLDAIFYLWSVPVFNFSPTDLDLGCWRWGFSFLCILGGFGFFFGWIFCDVCGGPLCSVVRSAGFLGGVLARGLCFLNTGF